MSDLMLFNIDPNSPDNTVDAPFDATELTLGVYLEDTIPPAQRREDIGFNRLANSGDDSDSVTDEMTDYVNMVADMLEDQERGEAPIDIDEQELRLCFVLREAHYLKEANTRGWQLGTLGFKSAIENKPVGVYLNTDIIPLAVQVYVKYMKYLDDYAGQEDRPQFRF